MYQSGGGDDLIYSEGAAREGVPEEMNWSLNDDCINWATKDGYRGVSQVEGTVCLKA